VLVFAISALFSSAVPASADTQSVQATRVEGGSLVFQLKGVVRASGVKSARLRIGGFKRKLSTRQVRRAARRGVLRVRLPRKRHRLPRKRRHAVKAPAPRSSTPSHVTVQQARLVVTTEETATDPRKPCPIPGDAHYVAPSGSDDNPGTAHRPWRTLDKAESESVPGMTVVLRSGTYGSLGHVTYLAADGTPSAPISWVAAPREAPLIHGHVAIDGNNRRICGLIFDGPTGPTANPQPGDPEREQDKIYVAGDDLEISNSEVRGSRWHSGIYLAGAERFRLINNYIHDNGRFDDPSHANLDHGIYVGIGSGLIEGNRIEHNLANAVQLYPRAHDVTVRRNDMSGHGRAAVMIAEDASNNLVVENRIYGNRAGVQTWSLRGRGNVVRSNQLWNNREGNFVATDGLLLAHNDSR
jgi:hypothetical protein